MKNIPGFTLIETLLYLTIFVTFIGALSFGLWQFINYSSSYTSKIEVEQTMRFLEDKVKYYSKNSYNLDTTNSVFGSSNGKLVLEHNDSGIDPVVFDLSSGTMRITKGVGSPIFLTPSTVTVGDFIITNRSNPKAPDSFSIDLTITSDYTDAYSKTSHFSLTLRKN